METRESSPIPCVTISTGIKNNIREFNFFYACSLFKCVFFFYSPFNSLLSIFDIKKMLRLTYRPTSERKGYCWTLENTRILNSFSYKHPKTYIMFMIFILTICYYLSLKLAILSLFIMGIRIYLHYISVIRQKIVILPGEGIYYESVYYYGKQTKEFIHLSTIQDIIINEVVFRSNILYALCITYESYPGLCVLFKEMAPKLKLLLPVYYTTRQTFKHQDIPKDFHLETEYIQE
ncbi:hypothetical protein WA158_000497 [Blastocystis sp. Blastoise]